jgi:hypothetical protein
MSFSGREFTMADREFWDHWDDGLSECIMHDIKHGDCRLTREFFNSHFWGGTTNWSMAKPVWENIKLALKAENKPMLKLLATWGAQVTDEDMARLRAAAKEQYPHYIRLLRQAGVPLSPAALKEIPLADVQPPAPETLIPEEWKRVLRAFQEGNGGYAAFIGGAALCDLFNERGARRKVDIFLNSIYNDKMNQRTLENAFQRTGLEITEGALKLYGGKPFPQPHFKKLPSRKGDSRINLAQSWTVVAGPQQMQYNIVFVDMGAEGNALVSTPGKYLQRVINDFDFSMNQIAYDGEQVVTTPAYDADVKNHQIALKNKTEESKEQLQRLVKKYPAWKLCAESKKLLPPDEDWKYYSMMMFPH